MRLLEISGLLEKYLNDAEFVKNATADNYHILVELANGSRFIIRLQNAPQDSVKSQKRKEIIESLTKKQK